MLYSLYNQYVGLCWTQPNGPFELSNSAKDVMLCIQEPIYGSARNVTLDNWFVSYPVVQELPYKIFRL